MCPSASRRRCIAIDPEVSSDPDILLIILSPDHNSWDVFLENSSPDAEVIQAFAQYASHVEVQCSHVFITT